MSGPPRLPPRSQGSSAELNPLEAKMAQSAGKALSNAANNEENQKRVGQGIGNAAQNEDNQEKLGNALAQKTDNKYLQGAAQNKSLQKGMGKALGVIANNRTVQKHVGAQVGKQAEDQGNQQRVVNGFKGTMNEEQSSKYNQVSGFASNSLVQTGYLQSSQQNQPQQNHNTQQGQYQNDSYYNQQGYYDQQGQYQHDSYYNQQGHYDQHGYQHDPYYNQQGYYDQQGYHNQHDPYYNQQGYYDQQGYHNQHDPYYNQQGYYDQQGYYNQHAPYNQQGYYDQPEDEEEPPELPPKLPPKNRNSVPPAVSVPPVNPARSAPASSAPTSDDFPAKPLPVPKRTALKPSRGAKPTATTTGAAPKPARTGKPARTAVPEAPVKEASSVPVKEVQHLSLKETPSAPVRETPAVPSWQAPPPLPSRQGPPLPSRQGPPLPSRQGPPVPSRQGPPPPSHSTSHPEVFEQNEPLELLNATLIKLVEGEIGEQSENTALKVTHICMTANNTTTVATFSPAVPTFNIKSRHYLFYDRGDFSYVKFDKFTNKDLLLRLDAILEKTSGFLGLDQYKEQQNMTKGLVTGVALADFTAADPTQLSLTTGDQLVIRQKGKNGWTLVQRKTEKGWVPATYVREDVDNVAKGLNTTATGIEKGGQVVGKGVAKGGELLGTGFRKISEQAQKHSQPTEKPYSPTQKDRKNLEKTEKASEVAATGIHKVSLGVGKAASFLGKGASNLYHNSDYYKNKEAEKQEQGATSNKKMDAGTNVAKASFGAVGSVVHGFGDAVTSGAKGARDARVDYVKHTKGTAAAEDSHRCFNITGNTIKGGYEGANLMKTTTLEFATHVAVEGVIGDETPQFCLGTSYLESAHGEFQGWAIELWHKRYFRLKPKALVLYQNPDKKPDLYVPIGAILDIEFPPKATDPKHPHAFGLRLRDQTVHFSLESLAESKKWVSAIRNLRKAIQIAGIGKYY